MSDSSIVPHLGPAIDSVLDPALGAETPAAAPSKHASRGGLRPYVWSLCGCAWFAAMGILTHDLGRPVDESGTPACPWTVVCFVRSVVATLCAASLAVATGKQLVLFASRSLWVRSLAGSTSMVATFYALAHLHVTDVLTLTNTSPIWVSLLAWPMGAERPTRGVLLAVAFSVCGVAVALQPHGDGFRPMPVCCALFAAFFTAVAMLGLNRLRGIAPLAIVAHFSAVSACFGGAAWFLADGLGVDIDAAGDPGWYRDPAVWAEIVAVGVTATVGQVFLTLAFSRGRATRVSVVGLSQVVMVMGLEAALGWKAVTPVMIVGTAMVLGPTAWLMARERKL
jgi:drug/metabolite transporter (DMT)-like permease